MGTHIDRSNSHKHSCMIGVMNVPLRPMTQSEPRGAAVMSNHPSAAHSRSTHGLSGPCICDTLWGQSGFYHFWGLGTWKP